MKTEFTAKEIKGMLNEAITMLDEARMVAIDNIKQLEAIRAMSNFDIIDFDALHSHASADMSIGLVGNADDVDSILKKLANGPDVDNAPANQGAKNG